MVVETVDDPVEVLTLFREGRIEPKRFKWKGRVIRVRRVTGDWSTRAGRDRILHFAIQGENADYFEIAYHLTSHRWRLKRVWVDG